MRKLIWIDERDALTLHGRLLALHGGAAGLRDDSLLQSALARPHQHHAYGDSPDVIELAAIYTAAILRNHPFIDGNKRTGFLIGVLFLELNGYRFDASEEDAQGLCWRLRRANSTRRVTTGFSGRTPFVGCGRSSGI